VSRGPSSPSRDFRLLLLGQTLSQLGTQVSAVAIPLLAVLSLHASPWQLGLVSASSTLAFAVIGLQAGAWLDRLRRRPVLIAADLVRALLLASIPVGALLGRLTVTQLVVVSLLVGAARVFFDVGYTSYLPSLVGPDRLLAGNSALETVRAGGQIAGPGLGGWLVTLVGAADVVLVQVLTFTASGLALLAIRSREPAPSRPVSPTPLRTQIAAGLAFVRSKPVLRAIALASAASNFSFAMASAVTLLFLSRGLGLSPTRIGLTLTAGSVSVLLAASLTPGLARRLGSARVIWVALAVSAPVSLLTPLARPGWSVALVVVAFAVSEAGQIVYAITSGSLRQRLCPPDLLGRVSATMRFLIIGGFPLGALLGGLLGELLGLRLTLVLAGILLSAAPVPLYRALHGFRDTDDLPTWREDS
jgi:MFS family permease